MLFPDPIGLPDTGQAVSFGSLIGSGVALAVVGLGLLVLRLTSRPQPAEPLTPVKIAGAIVGLALGVAFAAATGLAALSLVSIVFIALPADFGLFDFATLVAGWVGLCVGVMTLLSGKGRFVADTMWISQIATGTLAVVAWWLSGRSVG